jgi:hypothetical protein
LRAIIRPGQNDGFRQQHRQRPGQFARNCPHPARLSGYRRAKPSRRSCPRSGQSGRWSAHRD